MKIKEYFDMEIKTAAIFFAAGVVVGYLSFLLNSSGASLVLAVVVAVALSYVLRSKSKEKKDVKWWFGNGVILFLLTWFVFWTIFYNVLVF